MNSEQEKLKKWIITEEEKERTKVFQKLRIEYGNYVVFIQCDTYSNLNCEKIEKSINAEIKLDLFKATEANLFFLAIDYDVLTESKKVFIRESLFFQYIKNFVKMLKISLAEHDKRLKDESIKFINMILMNGIVYIELPPLKSKKEIKKGKLKTVKNEQKQLKSEDS